MAKKRTDFSALMSTTGAAALREVIELEPTEETPVEAKQTSIGDIPSLAGPSFEEEYENLQKEVQRLRQANLTLQAKVANAEDLTPMIDSLQLELSSVKSQLEYKQNTIVELQAQVDSLTVQSAGTEIDNLRNQIELKDAQIAALEVEAQKAVELSAINDSLSTEVNQLKSNLEAQTELLNSKEVELTVKQEALNSTLADYQCLQSSQLELRNYVETLEAELKSSKGISTSVFYEEFDEKHNNSIRDRARVMEERMVSNRPIVKLQQNVRFSPLTAKQLGTLTVQLLETTGYDFTVTDLVNIGCDLMWDLSEAVPGFLCKLQDRWNMPAPLSKEEQKTEARKQLLAMYKKILPL